MRKTSFAVGHETTQRRDDGVYSAEAIAVFFQTSMRTSMCRLASFYCLFSLDNKPFYLPSLFASAYFVNLSLKSITEFVAMSSMKPRIRAHKKMKSVHLVTVFHLFKAGSWVKNTAPCKFLSSG